MTEPPAPLPAKSPVDVALDTFVYAPIGLLFEGSSLFPQLVEKGRNQVTMARMIGQFALQQAGEEVTKAASRLSDQAAGVLDLIGGSVTPSSEPPPAPAPTSPASRPPRRAKADPSSTSPARAAARKVAAGTAVARRPEPTTVEPGAVATALAIPDYDGLSASHVVNRLAGLDPEELDAVRRYELANRGRKTILSKIAQLQSS